MTETQFVVTVIVICGLILVGLIVVGTWKRRDEKPLDLSLIDRNICPIHTDQPADGSGCTCTWLLPWSPEQEQAATERAWQRAAREVEIAQLNHPIATRLLAPLDVPDSQATSIGEYPAWMRRLDQRRAETGSILDGLKPATDEEYYAGDSDRFGHQR